MDRRSIALHLSQPELLDNTLNITDGKKPVVIITQGSGINDLSKYSNPNPNPNPGPDLSTTLDAGVPQTGWEPYVAP